MTTRHLEVDLDTDDLSLISSALAVKAGPLGLAHRLDSSIDGSFRFPLEVARALASSLLAWIDEYPNDGRTVRASLLATDLTPLPLPAGAVLLEAAA